MLAWTVVIEPSWPVFMAWIMSSVSAPRHSPMMIRSGRIRSAFFTRSVAVTAPRPSMLARPGLQPHDVVLLELQLGGVFDRDDAMVGLDEAGERVQSVVLPEPVPPEMMTFSRAFIAPSISASISGVNALKRSRSSLESGLRAEHPDRDHRRRRGPAGG